MREKHLLLGNGAYFKCGYPLADSVSFGSFILTLGDSLFGKAAISDKKLLVSLLVMDVFIAADYSKATLYRWLRQYRDNCIIGLKRSKKRKANAISRPIIKKRYFWGILTIFQNLLEEYSKKWKNNSIFGRITIMSEGVTISFNEMPYFCYEPFIYLKIFVGAKSMQKPSTRKNKRRVISLFAFFISLFCFHFLFAFLSDGGGGEQI